MGNIYIFRGKAASGKTTLSDMLAKKLSIPVIRKDDIVVALNTTPNINEILLNNVVYYNILRKIIQTNLDLGVDIILDTIPPDKNSAKRFLEKLDFKDNKVLNFFIVCSDEKEWERRHIERIEDPMRNQSWKSFEQVLEYYKDFDISPLENEIIIDNAGSLGECFENILMVINSRTE